MLELNGGIKLWFVKGINNMRYGKYRLFSEVEALGRNPYNGDAYIFMSRNRRVLKIIRYKNNKRFLYDVTYDPRYKFMQPVNGLDKAVYELDFKYLVALLECPVREQLSIQS